MKTILISGASSGIGAATAELFLEKGWTVGLLARNAGRLEEVAAGRANAVILEADVRHADQVEASFDRFLGAAGRLDVVFNNAGFFGPSAPIDEVAVADWEDVMLTNIHGMFLVARAAFARMRKQSPQGGRIINNGSLSAHSPREGSVCYTTSKHAITGLTRSLSLDGRPVDIACGQIDIGNAATPLVHDLNARREQDGLAALPMMDVEDVARSVWHMASLPPDANVQFMTVMATKMPYIGRG